MAAGETLSSHAAAASLRAMEMAGVSAADIDMVLLSTSTPDDLFGSACHVRRHRHPSPYADFIKTLPPLLSTRSGLQAVQPQPIFCTA